MCSLFLDLSLPFQDLGCRELNLDPTRFYLYLKTAKHFFKVLADTQSDTEVEIDRTIVIYIKTKKEVVFYFASRVCLGSRERTLRTRGVAREQIAQFRTVF